MKVNFKSISFRLVFGGVLIVLVPMIVVGWLSYDKSHNALSDAAIMQTEGIAKDLAQLTYNTLKAEINQAGLMAAQRKIISLGSSIEDVGLDSVADEKVIDMFTDLKNQFHAMGNHYQGIFLADSSGKLYTGILESGKEYKGSDISSRAYFQKAKGTRKTVLSEIVMSKSTGKPIVVVCVPVIDLRQRFVGVLGMVIKAEFFTELISGRKIGETGYGYMINNKSQIIAHPDKGVFLNVYINSIKEMEVITNRMLAGDSGVESYEFKGTEKIAAFAPVGLNGWSVAVTLNREEFEAGAINIRNSSILVTFIAALLTIVALFFSSRSIINPINAAVAGLKDIAQGEGDLTKRLNADRQDEVGEMAGWFNAFLEKLQGIISGIAENAKQVDRSASELTEIAGQMSSSAEDTSQRTNSVSVAAEEMSSNLNAVAAAMEESSTNASMVATASEEMSATINEIAANAEKASGISGNAVHQSKSAAERMAQLGKAAQEISKVTETITEISEQTNLLALNATIEAARAGEAGKGFAVVANEIKDLAKQTAEATLDIKKQIEGIQTTTGSSITEIDEVSSVITSVNDIVATIATAVDEQSTATKEIASNISQATVGIQEVNENVAQSSIVASEITQDITNVNSSTDEISNSSGQIRLSAEDMQTMAVNLNKIVGGFKI